MITKKYQKRTSMDSIVSELLGYLNKSGKDGKRIIKEIRKIKNIGRDNVYSILLKMLTHLDFSEKEAKNHWYKIINHRKKLIEKLDRDVGIMVSMADFFVNIDKKLKNPKAIEIAIYQETEKKAITDTLTGLYNYRFFIVNIKKEVERSKRTGLPLSLIMLDIDNFKLHNDTYGHLNGDQLLRIIANILKNNIRAPDSVYRYGGEEFTVLLPNTDKISALNPAKKIMKAIKNYDYKSEKIPVDKEKVTVSCGIASYPIDAKHHNDLIDKSDRALYQAKYEGKNRACLFSLNRRRFFRISFDCALDFETLTTSKGIMHGRLINISEGGLAFFAENFLSPHTDLKIKICPDDNKDAMELIGKVVRAARSSACKNKKYPYEIGLEFVKIRQVEKSRLKRLVANKMKK